MDPLNSTIVNSTSPVIASLPLALPLGLGSVFSALGGTGGATSIGILLSTVVPLLMSTSSLVRDWALGPFRWFLDAFFLTAYIRSSSPVYSWIVTYITSQPQRAHTSGKIEIQVVKDSDVEERQPSARGRYSFEEDDKGFNQDASTARLHSYKYTPFPPSHTLLLQDGNLVLISRSKVANYSLVKEDGQARQRDFRNDDDRGEDGEEIDYLKIRVIPVPPLLSALKPLYSRFLASLPPTTTTTTTSSLPPFPALDNLVATSKSFYATRDSRGTSVYRFEQYGGGWRRKVTREKKSIDSVILPGGIGTQLLRDIKEFLGSKKWYQERGIPHRRGVLLFGSPGSGKTSIVTAISSELSLNIYLLTLSDESMTDSELLNAISETPPNCLILIEDIDVAFVAPRSSLLQPDSSSSRSNTITLSGLLNALDGVCSVDGRVLVATTNHIEQLDPALKRPGRFDVQISFTLACTEQIERFFVSMMSPTASERERATRTPAENSEKAGSSSAAVNDGAWAEERRDLVEKLSKEFGSLIPEETFSTASLQAYLLKWKENPQGAVDGAAGQSCFFCSFSSRSSATRPNRTDRVSGSALHLQHGSPSNKISTESSQSENLKSWSSRRRSGRETTGIQEGNQEAYGGPREDSSESETEEDAKKVVEEVEGKTSVESYPVSITEEAALSGSDASSEPSFKIE